MPSDPSRREAVLVLGGGLAVLWSGCTGEEGSETASPDTGTPATTEDSGEPAAEICAEVPTPTEAWTALSSSDSKALADVGAWLYVDVGTARLVVARPKPDCLVAVSRICTHQGCEIEYQYEYRRFKCPCHGAIYGEDGSKVAGPQPRAVAAFPVGVGSDGLVYVDV